MNNLFLFLWILSYILVILYSIKDDDNDSNNINNNDNGDNTLIIDDEDFINKLKIKLGWKKKWKIA